MAAETKAVNVRHDSIQMPFIHERNMGWLRSVGSLKLQVSFAKEPDKRDNILLKRPIILRSLLIESTPYRVCERFKQLMRGMPFIRERYHS